MRKWTLSFAALALVAAPVLAGEYNKVISIGDKAPATAAIPAVSADGAKDISLQIADAKEDVLVVVFLANHCPAVQATEDRLYDLVKSYKGKSVKFVGVCSSSAEMKSDDGIDAIKAKIKANKYNLAYGVDEDGKVGKAFGAVKTPEFFVMDKTRAVRYTGRLDDADRSGKTTKTYVKTAIDALLSGESVEVTETKAVGCGIMYAR